MEANTHNKTLQVLLSHKVKVSLLQHVACRMSFKSDFSVSMQKNSMKLDSETLMIAQLVAKIPFLFPGKQKLR
jgi:hypothetical protein